MSTLMSYDDAIETAYDIFLEMAPDNLEPADVIIFTAQFDDRGAAELMKLAMTGHAMSGSMLIKVCTLR